MKKFFTILISAILLISLFSACSNDEPIPEIPEDELISEEPSEPEIFEEPSEPEIFEEPSEPEEFAEETSETEEKIDPHSFITFDEISALGCYPIWMKPNTIIIYDETGCPQIIQGGELLEEDCSGDETYYEIGFINLKDKTFKIRPNTKVEYYKDGFIQNIYFLWPDGSYNLSPLSQTENAKITYYENIEEYENKTGETVVLSESQCHSVFWIADGMNLLPESTTKPMDFPRYEITFTYIGTEHLIHVDRNNVFTSTMLNGGNYVSSLDENHYSKVEKLFNQAH